MNPGFDLSEAQQMLALAYAADILGPKKNENSKGFHILTPNNDVNDALPNDDGTTYPYPVAPIWPTGWTPAIPASDKLQNVWHNSILAADPDNIPVILADLKVGANNVLLAYNADQDAYVVSFAGTENITGAMDDVSFISVPAGPLNYDLYKSTANYMINPDYYNQPNANPKVVNPAMHFGFRVAVEEYTVKAGQNVPHNLINVFKGLNKSSINLYVTGHSLGAAMAGVFSAWVQAGDFANLTGIKTVNLKTYTFASPKWANDAMANNYDNGITKNGYSFRVVNNLDSVPQIPPTYETASDLNNPAMVKNLLPVNLPDIVTKWAKILGMTPTLNYVHVGTPFVAQGSFPVVFAGTAYPASLFPGGNKNNLQPTTLTQQWWQHWPYVYYAGMTASFSAAASN